jgi:transcriptional regulator with XRE-family HTH domain
VDHRGDMTVADREPAVEALVQPLRDRLHATGCSHAELARRLCRDRSGVSRALAGRHLPPLHLVVEIATALGVDTDLIRRGWERASAISRAARRCGADGRPPADMHDYAGFVAALRDLLAGRGISHRTLVRRDDRGSLRLSTVGAVLRGDRSARHDVVIAIVRACGVTDDAAIAWDAAWRRVGYAHRLEQDRRRRDAFERCRAPYRPPRRR